MQKRKLSKIKEADHFDDEYADAEHMAEMMNDLAMNHHGADNVTAQLASAAMSAAIDLSKLVVENRIRNASNMDDDDIYNIYQKSFESVMNTTTGLSDEN
jgi:hypothetical protein